MKRLVLATLVLGAIATAAIPAFAGQSALRFTTTQQLQMTNNEVEELPPQENVAATYTTSYRHCCRPYLSHFYGPHVGYYPNRGGYYYGPHFSYRSLFRSVDVYPGGIDVGGLFYGWSIGW